MGKCLQLVVHPVRIHFGSEHPTTGVFVIPGLSCVCLEISGKFKTLLGKIPICESVTTDECGEFCIEIPKKTCQIHLVIKFTIGVQCYLIEESFSQYPSSKLEMPIDGMGNNPKNPEWGMAKTLLPRMCAPVYGDGKGSIRTGPNPRAVSNAVCKMIQFQSSTYDLTDMTWVWGQFLDHELDLTKGGGEDASFQTPLDDQYPGRIISFTRSGWIERNGIREQPNDVSSIIDGSNVYGESCEKSRALRALDGSGKMKVSIIGGREYLPFNTFGVEMDTQNSPRPETFFAAGDIRANENTFLTAMHTLWIREHNCTCDELVEKDPGLKGKDELIYWMARRIVVALIQQITVKEFLPALLGDHLPKFPCYNDSVNPSIATEFSSAGFRLGHSMLTSDFLVNGKTLQLRDIFFKPEVIQQESFEACMHAPAQKKMKEIDSQIIDDVRDFLFGPPTQQHILDLPALNIMRGRDHGVPPFNTVRQVYGLPPMSFADFGPEMGAKLASVYSSPDEIDVWVGIIAEPHLNRPVGDCARAIIRDQFLRLRDGDRFWYENDREMKKKVKGTKLSDVIIRNTGFTIQEDVFHIE